MGSFHEDEEIQISLLIKQWVAEGFLKPRKTKDLEEIAEEYLTDLIERNLILVKTNEWSEKPFSCKIHDLLRDLCLREAHKEKFIYVPSHHELNIMPQDISTQRRIAIFESTSNEEYYRQVLHNLESASLARSLICHIEAGALSSLGFRLLRVLKAVCSSNRSYDSYLVEDTIQLINLRYLDVPGFYDTNYSVFPSIHLFWNLQTLIITNVPIDIISLSEFWMMRQLRHVQVDKLYLPNASSDQMDKQGNFVMENLQTLATVSDFRLSEEVGKSIPNVKDLKIQYLDYERFELASYYCLNNHDRLHKLECLECSFGPLICRNPYYFENNTSFPNSLKKLYLRHCSIDWEEINIKIGSLPFLQSLALVLLTFTNSKWKTVEGQFTSLKYLMIYSCSNLESWTSESTHFPLLEFLHISGLEALMEIPSDIGEIPTLKSIQLDFCSDSAVISAKRIADDQEEIGNEDLQVRVTLHSRSEQKELVSSRNFHVEVL